MIKELTLAMTSLPLGWESKEFEKCLKKVIYSKKIKRKEFLNEGLHPIISQEKENINGYWDKSDDLFKVNKPVVIFGDHTKILKYIDFDFVLGADGVKILLANENINSKYLFYFLQNMDLGDLGYARHYRLLKEIQISYPKSLPQQKHIVATLDKAFAAMDTAKANAEKNLQNAKELFESYLQNIFENKGGNWDEKTLGDENLLKIVDGDRGKNYPVKADFKDDGYCLFMNTKNVRNDGFLFVTKMFITKEKDKSMGKGKLTRNDIVMTTRGTIGNLGVYNENIPFDNIRINSGMLIFRPNQKVVTSQYLFELFRSGIMKNLIKRHVSGAAQPQLPIKTLVNFTLPIPPLNQQKQIVQKLNTLSIETKKLEAIYTQKIADLEEMKKSVLQKAFSGQLNTIN